MPTASGHRLLQTLRARAQAQLQHREGASETTDPMQHLLNELETHQLELEMQNEELLTAHHTAEQARLEAEQARNDYARLFEHAPVAFVTLTPAGLIERVNHQACQLLATTAARLVARRFLLFVAPAFRPAATE